MSLNGVFIITVLIAVVLAIILGVSVYLSQKKAKTDYLSGKGEL